MQETFLETASRFVREFVDSAVSFGPRLLLIFVVFSAFYLIAQVFKYISRRTVDVNLYKKPSAEAVHRYNRTRRLILVSRFIWLILIVVATIAALSISGISITSVIEGAGFLALGLSFALNQHIAQYYAGFLILSQKEINIGDHVEVNGNKGIIKAIEPRFTTIVDFTQRDIHVPNTDLLTNAIRITPTAGKIRDFIRVRIAKTSDIKKAIEVGETGLAVLHGVTNKQPPKGYARYFGDGIMLAFYYTIPGTRRETFIVRDEAIQTIKKAFDKAGIEINYPVTGRVEEPVID